MSLILIMGGEWLIINRGKKWKSYRPWFFPFCFSNLYSLLFPNLQFFFTNILLFSTYVPCFLLIFPLFPISKFFPVFLSSTSYVRMTIKKQGKNHGPTMIFIFLPCFSDLPKIFPIFFKTLLEGPFKKVVIFWGLAIILPASPL